MEPIVACIGRDCTEEGGRRGRGRGRGGTEWGIGYWVGAVVDRRHSWLVGCVLKTA